MHRRRALVLFAVAEVLLALAIPFILVRGYHTLLDSRAGTLVEAPARVDPSWVALVAPSKVIGVAEVDGGRVTGVTLVVQNPERTSAGSAILVPGSLEVDGLTLSQREPSEAVAAVSAAMRLGVERVDVLDAEGWAAVLGDARYAVSNPDPVPGHPPGEVLVPVGEVEVDGSTVAAFAGRPAVGAAPISVLPRRHLLWAAMLADPPVTDHPLALDLVALGDHPVGVVDLPVTQLEPVALLDPERTESLVRDRVAYPTGATNTDRLRVRVVDRSGTADLEGIAAAVAAHGVEVVEIANASVFDEGPTRVVAPAGLASVDDALPGLLAELAQVVGVGEVVVDEVVVDDQHSEEPLVTVVIGRDFALDSL